MVDMVDINTTCPDSINDIIKLLILNKMILTKDLLKSINFPYIGWIPIFSEDYINESKNLTQ